VIDANITSFSATNVEVDAFVMLTLNALTRTGTVLQYQGDMTLVNAICFQLFFFFSMMKERLLFPKHFRARPA
jgi:hypothetical protein